MNIKIKKNGCYLNYKRFNFPAGEVGIKLNTNDYRYLNDVAGHQTIIARIQNSDDLIALAMIKDALERWDKTPINLFIPFLPYGRQDRICDFGESFSLKVIGDYINHLNFNKVITVDPHSHVTEAVINKLKVITQLQVINKYLDFINRIMGCILISPDIGANKKISEVAKFLNHEFFVRVDKLRNLQTGEIIETIVYKDDFKGRDVVIIDDLADGAASFIYLAKILKTKNVGKIILFVTHGIFSKGVDICFDNGIDELWTTTSFFENYDKRVNVFDLNYFISL